MNLIAALSGYFFARNRAGFWFEAMRARGDSDRVVMTQIIGGKIHSPAYLHAETDGVGALHRLFSEQGFNEIALKGLGSSQKIPHLQRARQFFTSFRKIQATSTQWPMRDLPLSENLFFFLSFSAEETEFLKNLCKARGLNLRVFLLFHFHHHFSKWLTDEPKQGTWLIPVSVRRPDQLSEYENLASYFLLPIQKGASIEQISFDFNREIKSGAYWGTYLALQLVSLLGPRAIRWISNRNARRGSFMGTFSDLGEWTCGHPDREIQDQTLASAPPASTPYPIGVSKLILNGRMTVGVRINRRIRTPERESIQKDLEQLKRSLFN